MDTDKIIGMYSIDSLMGDHVTDYNLRCWHWFVHPKHIDAFVNKEYYKEHNLYFPHYVFNREVKFIFTSGLQGGIAIGHQSFASGSNSIAIGNNATVVSSSVAIGLSQTKNSYVIGNGNP